MKSSSMPSITSGQHLYERSEDPDFDTQLKQLQTALREKRFSELITESNSLITQILNHIQKQSSPSNIRKLNQNLGKVYYLQGNGFEKQEKVPLAIESYQLSLDKGHVKANSAIRRLRSKNSHCNDNRSASATFPEVSNLKSDELLEPALVFKSAGEASTYRPTISSLPSRTTLPSLFGLPAIEAMIDNTEFTNTLKEILHSPDLSTKRINDTLSRYNFNITDPLLGFICSVSTYLAIHGLAYETLSELDASDTDCITGYIIGDHHIELDKINTETTESVNALILGYSIKGDSEKVTECIDKKDYETYRRTKTWPSRKQNRINNAVKGYAIGGHMKLLQALIEKNEALSNYASIGFAIIGNDDKMSEYKRSNTIQHIQIYASQGNEAIVNELLVDNNKDNISAAIKAYATKGFNRCVDHLLVMGDYLNTALEGYAKGGHSVHVNQLIVAGADFDRAIEIYNHIPKFSDIKDELLDRSEQSYEAAKLGNFKAVETLIALGTSVPKILQGYAEGGHHKQVNQLIEKHIDPSHAIKGYAISGNEDYVNQLLGDHKHSEHVNLAIKTYESNGHHRYMIALKNYTTLNTINTWLNSLTNTSGANVITFIKNLHSLTTPLDRVDELCEFLKSVFLKDDILYSPELHFLLHNNFFNLKSSFKSDKAEFELNIINILNSLTEKNHHGQLSHILRTEFECKAEFIKGNTFISMYDNIKPPLFVAAQKGYETLTTLLIECGADVNQTIGISSNWRAEEDLSDLTPLMKSTASCAEILLQNGADINAKAGYSLLQVGHYKDSLYYAIYDKDIKKLKVLMGHQHKLSSMRLPFSHGKYALYLASEIGFLDGVKCLIKNGANINNSSNESRFRRFSNRCCRGEWQTVDIGTAIVGAAENGHDDIVCYLMNKGASTKDLPLDKLKEDTKRKVALSKH